jgi:hypothetical protein
MEFRVGEQRAPGLGRQLAAFKKMACGGATLADDVDCLRKPTDADEDEYFPNPLCRTDTSLADIPFNTALTFVAFKLNTPVPEA